MPTNSSPGRWRKGRCRTGFRPHTNHRGSRHIPGRDPRIRVLVRRATQNSHPRDGPRSRHRPAGNKWLDGMGGLAVRGRRPGRIPTRNKVHYEMDTGKIVIVDQAEHGLQRNPKTTSESRWSAEPGKASLAQAVEAKEIRAAEAVGESANSIESWCARMRRTPRPLMRSEIYRHGGAFFDEVTGASGTLTDLNPVLEKIYGLEQAHSGSGPDTSAGRGRPRGGREHPRQTATLSPNMRTRCGPEARADSRRSCATATIWSPGRWRRWSARACPGTRSRRSTPSESRGWGGRFGSQVAEGFRRSRWEGKILVINRQGQRGVDISVSRRR